MTDIAITIAAKNDLDELAALYDDLNDYLAAHTNYPGWMKDIYPVRETAETGIKEGTLYVCRENGTITGTIILNHQPETAYQGAPWLTDAKTAEALVIHTLAVHPDHTKKGIGRRLLQFAEELGRAKGMKAIRLDVFRNNKPAIALYERAGYRYIAAVDLGLRHRGLDEFCLYELVL